jgi:hypothetical protein
MHYLHVHKTLVLDTNVDFVHELEIVGPNTFDPNELKDV